jgi:hypothetical protein
MITLARMLLTQKLRKQRRQYGIHVVLTVAALLLLVLWKLSSIFAHVLAFQAPSRLGAGLQAVWIGWAAMGVLTGRDLTWHIRIERLTVFRRPFGLLYALDLLLSLVTYPMFIVFGIVLFYGARTGWPLQHWAAAVAGLLCFVWTVRLVVSIARTLMQRRDALSAAQRVAGSVLLVCGAAAMFARVISPGDDLAAVLLHGQVPAALFGQFCLLLALDFWLQRTIVYSGLAASVRHGAFRRTGSAFVTAGGKWPTTAWRVAMLGMLRNTNVVLLVLWGVAYGFLYTWFQKSADTTYFLMFTWMMLLFHSWIRANLFGVDHRAAWMYFALPVRPVEVVAAKTSALTLLQSLMVAAVLLPALLKPGFGPVTPLQWACVLGFAVSGILLSEILGSVFSLLHPDPIERGAMYSGAMTLGAFVIPGALLVLVILYGVVNALAFRIPIPARWIIYLGIPLFLLVIRWRALPVFVQKILAGHRDDFLNQLDAVTP